MARHAASQQAYGIRSFELRSKLFTDPTQADARAEEILTRYAEGIPYMESEWRGDPVVTPGACVASSVRLVGADVVQSGDYEVLSQEITIDSGLRSRVKALNCTTGTAL